jgi:hypothetical protein
MSDIRTVNLDEKPEADVELRVVRDGCKVSLWLPADATAFAEALMALAGIGFEFDRSPQ